MRPTGRPARGIPLLEAALVALPEVDHACALLREALAMAMAAGLPEAVTRARAARELRLAAHGKVPAVCDLDEELRAAAALAP